MKPQYRRPLIRYRVKAITFPLREKSSLERPPLLHTDADEKLGGCWHGSRTAPLEVLHERQVHNWEIASAFPFVQMFQIRSCRTYVRLKLSHDLWKRLQHSFMLRSEQYSRRSCRCLQASRSLKKEVRNLVMKQTPQGKCETQATRKFSLKNWRLNE
jgi:hypothetical protein